MHTPTNAARRTATIQKPTGGVLLAVWCEAAADLTRCGVVADGRVDATGGAAVAGGVPPVPVAGSIGEAGTDGAATPEGPSGDGPFTTAGVSFPMELPPTPEGGGE